MGWGFPLKEVSRGHLSVFPTWILWCDVHCCSSAVTRLIVLDHVMGKKIKELEELHIPSTTSSLQTWPDLEGKAEDTLENDIVPLNNCYTWVHYILLKHFFRSPNTK